MLDSKPIPEARPGNIALDIERPLFNEGPNWDFVKFKENILSKNQA